MKCTILTMMLVFAAPVVLLGCSGDDAQAAEQADVTSNTSDTPDTTVTGGTQKSESVVPDAQETDLERLTRIQDRLRRAGLAEYAVIFGLAGQSNSHMVAIDYTLFDQLGDDAVACMIVNAMLHQSVQKQQNSQQTDLQNQMLSKTDILEVDFKTGLYMAKAGFASNGFSEWFQTNNELAVQQKSVTEISELQRQSVFMRGYQEIAAQTNKK